MVKKMAKRSTSNSVAEPSSPAEHEPANLKFYVWHDTGHAGFKVARFWWDGEGPRAGIKPWVEQKMRPGLDPKFGKAAKVEVLLPPTAPADYTCAEFLLRRFDETLPPFERHVMVHVKVELDPNEPWHVGYERVRGYARSHFAGRFPVILIAHIPTIAGIDGYGSHVHCIVLSRSLNMNGLTGACYRLCSDKGYEEAHSAWHAWIAGEERAA